MATFLVQYQVYDLARSLLTSNPEELMFLQMYFMSASENEVKRSSFVAPNIDSQILDSLQWNLQNDNYNFFYLPIVN
jgi:hypothetical protein